MANATTMVCLVDPTRSATGAMIGRGSNNKGKREIEEVGENADDTTIRILKSSFTPVDNSIFNTTIAHDDRDGSSDGDNDCDTEKLFCAIDEDVSDG